MERRATSKQGLLPEKRNDEGWTAVVPGAVKTRAYTSVGPDWKNEETPFRSLREQRSYIIQQQHSKGMNVRESCDAVRRTSLVYDTGGSSPNAPSGTAIC